MKKPGTTAKMRQVFENLMRQVDAHEMDVKTVAGDFNDWLAVVPPYLKDERIPWLDTGSFGCCDVSKHEREDGSTVYIGAHA